MQTQNDSSKPKQPFVRILRKIIYTSLPFIGAQVLISIMLFTQALPNMAMVVIGLLLLEVGIWKLAPKLMLPERKYHALRAQTDRFLSLIRQLNMAAIRVKEQDTPENRQAIEEIQQSMLQLVKHIIAVAGKTDIELTAAASLTQQNGQIEVAR